MRIAFDGRAIQGERRGPGDYAASLLWALAKNPGGHSVTVLLDQALPVPADGIPVGLPARRIGGFGGLPGWEQVHVPRTARDFDLLHCPANGAPLRCPVPVVLTLHDAIFIRPFRDISVNPYFRQYLGHLYRTRIYPRAARRARSVIAVSGAAKTEVAALMGVSPEKITVVPEAVPAAFAACVPADEKAVRRTYELEGKYLLGMGAYEKRKNISMLFRVMEWLASRAIDCPPLVLAGCGNLTASGYPDEVRERGIAHLVRFLPYLPTPVLKALFKGATVFLMPSRREGFGLPPLEAMSCGAPVIASDIPCHREVAGDAAILLDPDDETGWRTATARILDDGEAGRDLGRKGVARAAEFSWEKAASLTVEVYERTVKKA